MPILELKRLDVKSPLNNNIVRVKPIGQTMEPILIASDDTEWMSNMADTIAADGYKPYCATNGMEAYDHAAFLHPVLIILDVNLPVCDGMETCRLLRSEPSLPSQLPIFLTGTVAPSIKALHNVGATGFMPKYASSGEWHDLLVEHLRAYGKG